MQDRQGLHRYPSKVRAQIPQCKERGTVETMLQAVEDKGKDSHDGGDWKLVTSDNTDWS